MELSPNPLESQALVLILVANLGSTSFKYRLLAMPDGEERARGGIDRIGSGQASACFMECCGASFQLATDAENASASKMLAPQRSESSEVVDDHAAAVAMCLRQLSEGDDAPLPDASQLGGIGFKAVFAGNMSGVRPVNDELLAEMERLSDVAPAHNPPYVRAMRQLRAAFPDIPLVAALETGFHETIPECNRVYACPPEWREKYAVQRWGFHGASHRYVSRRACELLGDPEAAVISCHLGGSSSVCASVGGKSFAASMGMTPQTGLPQGHRVGDFDPFALPVVMRQSGMTLEECLAELSSKGGLAGLSGISADMRNIEEAAAGGDERAQLAIDHFVAQIRFYIGGYVAMLGTRQLGAVVFAGGIGENSRLVRQRVCEGLAFLGMFLDTKRNDAVGTDAAEDEVSIQLDGCPTAALVIPTNEERIVAEQTYELLSGSAH